MRVSLEVAKLLKKLGFNVGTEGSYTEYLETNVHDNPSFSFKKGEVETDTSFFINGSGLADLSCEHYTQYAAPTQRQVEDWLNEKHNKHIGVFPPISVHGIWCVSDYNIPNVEPIRLVSRDVCKKTAINLAFVKILTDLVEEMPSETHFKVLGKVAELDGSFHIMRCIELLGWGQNPKRVGDLSQIFRLPFYKLMSSLEKKGWVKQGKETNHRDREVGTGNYRITPKGEEILLKYLF